MAIITRLLFFGFLKKWCITFLAQNGAPKTVETAHHYLPTFGGEAGGEEVFQPVQETTFLLLPLLLLLLFVQHVLFF